MTDTLEQRIERVLKSAEDVIGSGLNCWCGNTLTDLYIEKMRETKEIAGDDVNRKVRHFQPVVWPVQSRDTPADNGGCDYSKKVAIFTDPVEQHFYAWEVPEMVSIILALQQRLKEAKKPYQSLADLPDEKYPPNASEELKRKIDGN